MAVSASSCFPAIPSLRIPEHDADPHQPEAGPSQPRTNKRDRGPHGTKRTRRGTPILEVPLATEGSLTSLGDGSRGRSVSLRASAAEGTEVDSGEVELPRAAAGLTSEGEQSVLFPEQQDEVSISAASGSTAVRGNMGDYIPQAEPEGGTSATDGMGEYLHEELMEDDEDGEENNDFGEGAEEGPGELEESQDQNDLDEDGDEAAETPAWLTEPHVLVRDPLEPPDKAAAKAKKEPGDARKTRTRSHQPEQPEEEEEQMAESYHSGDTDEYEMDHRPVLERTAIKRDIRKFVTGVEALRHPHTGEYIYRVVDRLGEGTFSSVYLAQDVFHHYSNNQSWTGEVDDTDSDEIPDARSQWAVALKKILVTSRPARIENELAILESLRGCRYVSELITAFREEDQVIIVLPYHPSDDFRHFYRHMDTPHIRDYMRCLLQGLKDIHKRGIIHRDVKPANFLFNYEESRGILCDFGLAERYVPPRKIMCQHAPATLENLHGTRTKTDDTTSVEQAVYNARKKAKLGEGKVGFNHDDKRPPIKTNRAGTRGFRAPEVLFKCPDQTVAIDIWSAGIILLSILTHKFPVFNSNDDTEALLEIAAIFGRNYMERCAMLHNRTIICNIPSMDTQPKDLNTLILKLNPHVYTPPITSPTSEEASNHIADIDEAIDLCKRLLHVDPTKRITADKALKHVFLRPRDESDWGWEDAEDEVEVILPTEGKCGHLHGWDGKKHKAYIGEELVEMEFGQGMPLSRSSLCPEHEHYQHRMCANPLTTCFAVPASMHQPPQPAPEKKAPVKPDGHLKERDVNAERRTETKTTLKK